MFVQSLSASVRLVGPQLSADESPLPGLTLRLVQDEGAKPLPPLVGAHGDHRNVGKAVQWIWAGTVLVESL